MTRNTFIAGGLLILIGVIGSLVSGFESWTSLIPAIIGAVLVVSGFIAVKNAMIGVHIALLVALVGALGTLMNVVQIGTLFTGTAERPLAVIASTLTFVVLVVFIVLGVRSFIAARRWKKTDGAAA